MLGDISGIESSRSISVAMDSTLLLMLFSIFVVSGCGRAKILNLLLCLFALRPVV